MGKDCEMQIRRLMKDTGGVTVMEVGRKDG